VAQGARQELGIAEPVPEAFLELHQVFGGSHPVSFVGVWRPDEEVCGPAPRATHVAWALGAAIERLVAAGRVLRVDGGLAVPEHGEDLLEGPPLGLGALG
jgi:hypothetical protein